MPTCPTCGASYASTIRLCTRDGTVLPIEPGMQDANAGKVLDGKYRLDAFLSHGGMGSVYRATHIMLDKTVAVKVINPDLVTSADIVARFQREARAASNLNHPNIVAVYDLGQSDDGTLYIAMEFIDGPSLKDVIRRTGPMPAARIVPILKEVTSALALAHSHNIIHRDLKPQNIMLATDTGQRQVAKLLDFGIAKTFDDTATQLTRTGFALGTPQYMSPEQAAGTDVDGRTDLYSLGAILYEMLTGEVPFTDPSTPALLIKLMTEIPEPPSRRKPDVPLSPALESMALRCLEKDPARRFDSAEAFADALGRVDVGVDAAKAAEVPTRMIPSSAASASAPTVRTPPVVTTPLRALSTTSAQQPMVPTAAPPAPFPPVEAPVRGRRSGGIWLAVAAVVFLLIGLVTLRSVLLRSGRTETVVESRATAPAPPPSTERSPQIPEATPARPAAGSPSGGNNIAAGGLPTPSEGSASAAQASPVTAAPAPANQQPTLPTTTATPVRAQAATGAASASPDQTPTPPALPENPPVFFQCVGVAEICAAVRSSLDRALDRSNLPAVRNADRAAIIVTASATVLQDRVTQTFGTALATRTYSVDVSGETGDGDVVAMPPARTFSFDAQFGRARLEENAGLIAEDIVERVRAFWKKRQELTR